MVWVRILGLKSFEKFSGIAATTYSSSGPGYISLDPNTKFQIFHIKPRTLNIPNKKQKFYIAYIRSETQEGLVPSHVLKIQRQKINTVDVCGMDLKLQVKIDNNQSSHIKPAYTNANNARTDFVTEVPNGSKINLAIKSGNDTIGFTNIDPKSILMHSENDTNTTIDIEIYTQSFKIHYLVVTMCIGINEEELDCFTNSRSFMRINSKSNDVVVLQAKVYMTMGAYTVPGTIIITPFKVFFSPETFFQSDCFNFPLMCIKTIKLLPKSLSISLKDLRHIEILADDLKSINDVICEHTANVVEKAVLYHVSMSQGLMNTQPYDEAYMISQEFSRLAGEGFRVSYINADYRLCESYPCLLFFPAHISDAVVSKVSEFRSRERVPAVTWCRGSIALYRSSQPKLGLGKRSSDDENFFSMAKIRYVIDARPGMNAKANRLKGKGYELEDNYPIKLKFMDIQNIHHVTRSFEALADLGNRKGDIWQVLADSKWMSHINLILDASLCTANHLIYEKASVLVHCSDGWDRTSQICALSQVLIDPFYRTFAGFRVLVVKDWFSFGHKFYDRTFGNDYSPIFLLFLDCMFQIIAQMPEEFEYNAEFMIYIADCSVSGVYGEFLANCEKDRNDVFLRTSSFWSFDWRKYRNLDYAPGEYKVLPVSCRAQDLKLWEFFTRYYE